mmetsp:Transcript_71881/g.181843  ORF Transcript_71881/g.181843 Transcript_71881/m.181843 type:complete len:207 (-) Transcript_71881:105-725(-)
MVLALKPQPSMRGEALKVRLAAQADAMLASADHPLRSLMKEADTSAARREQLAAAAKMMLGRPPIDPRPPPKAPEPVDFEALHRAAELGDLKTLAQTDKRLRSLLDRDDHMRLLKEGDLSDPAAKEALQLYKDSFMRLETGGRNLAKEAFQAVMKDDVETLKELLARGISPNARNSGGHTLLQLAQERGRPLCAAALLEAGATNTT